MNIYIFIALNTVFVIASFWTICYGFRNSQKLIRRKRKAIKSVRRAAYSAVRKSQQVLSKILSRIADENFQQCMDERPEYNADELSAK